MIHSRNQWSEWYRCLDCNNTWKHEWNLDDYSNDYTVCNNCGSFDFEDIEAPTPELVRTFTERKLNC
jgi:DNA-directed RNA polymerase subunit RPC12/RpoP